MSNQRTKSPQWLRPRRLGSLLASLCCLWPAIVAGQIFRYQDEQGNWHFTDDPPADYDSSVVPGIATSSSSLPDAELTEDLATRLQSAYNPITPIAYATLAVVSIKAGAVEGSGFFCSENGYILTNKHVVRPEPAIGLDERDRALEDRGRELQVIESNLKEAQVRLGLMTRDLEGYQELIDNARDDSTASWARSAHARLAQRYRTERGRISGMERSVGTLKRDLRRSQQNLGFARRFETGRKRFDIILKDGTELGATLVRLAEDQDLALLKLDGYRTPFLRLDSAGRLSQGIRVFAIGNPLGMQDAVTSGVVTRITPDHLLTDAQILPGSSGGPLIRESGEVLGINVSRKVATGTSMYAAGFGKVIPISIALDVFRDELAFIETQVVDTVRNGYSGLDGRGGFGSRWIESPSPSGGIGSEQSGSIGADWPANPGSGHGGASDAVPVRLIVPDDDVGLVTDEPVERASRSLDFPPEDGGIPPGISWPRD